MWEQIPLPAIESTIRACSIPENNDSLFIWTDQGVFRVDLHPTPAIKRMYTASDAEIHFEKITGRFQTQGIIHYMNGECGQHGWRTASNLLSNHPLGYSVHINEKQDSVQLLDIDGAVCLTVDSVNLKSKLLLANFSRNFSHRIRSPYFVVCDSTSLRVYVCRVPLEGVQPKWSERGSRESQQALWNVIIKNPDDDTPRLIYADWLEENGDRERAEFIRLQCRIAQRESQEFILPDDPDLILNEQIEKKYGDRWVSELNKMKGIRYSKIFWRGFPECQIDDISEVTRTSTDSILAATPFDTVGLQLFDDTDTEQLEKWELTSRLRNINVNSVDLESFQAYSRLFKSPRLAKLRKVTFSGWFSRDLNLAMATNGPFPQLHTIVYDNVQQHGPKVDYSVVGGAKSLPQLKNVIFSFGIVSRRLQQRKSIRKLASQVENVYQVVREWNKPDIVTRLHA